MYRHHGEEGLIELKRAVASNFGHGGRTFLLALSPGGAAELFAREIAAGRRERYRIEVQEFQGERLKASPGELPPPSRLGTRLLLIADAPRRFHPGWQEVRGIAITESLLTF